jgi:excisionase family DNA binding protein
MSPPSYGSASDVDGGGRLKSHGKPARRAAPFQEPRVEAEGHPDEKRGGCSAAPGRLLKVHEVQAVLGLGRSKVYELMASGVLPVVRLGPRVARVPAHGLQRWIEERTSALDAAA